MTKKKQKLAKMPRTQFVRFSLDIRGPDGIEVQYPYGWVSAPVLASIESASERMEYLLGFTEVYDDCIRFNRDICVPRTDIDDAKFSTIESGEIWDFTNDREYFTDAQFAKIIEWCKEYDRQLSEEKQSAKE